MGPHVGNSTERLVVPEQLVVPERLVVPCARKITARLSKSCGRMDASGKTTSLRTAGTSRRASIESAPVINSELVGECDDSSEVRITDVDGVECSLPQRTRSCNRFSVRVSFKKNWLVPRYVRVKFLDIFSGPIKAVEYVIGL